MKTCVAVFGAVCVLFSGGILPVNAGAESPGSVAIIPPSAVSSVPLSVPDNPVTKYEGSIPTVKPDSSVVYSATVIRPDPDAGYSLRVVGKRLPEDLPGAVKRAGVTPDPRTIPVESQKKIQYE